MLKIIKGDLIALHKQGKTIMHGCNCFANMGGGIARVIASEFPQAALADRVFCTAKLSMTGNNYAGQYSVAQTTYGMIINAYTQYTGGPDFCIEYLQQVCQGLDYSGTIYVPAIGCGIGGGDLVEVQNVLRDSNLDFVMVLLP